MQACAEFTAPGGYVARVYEFPSGVFEACAVFRPAPRKPELPAIRAYTEDELAARELDNVRRATARAKSAVRRLCLSSGADRLLTLTFRENVEDLNVAWDCFARFVRRIRDKAPKWVYVAVPERQKRGAIHFHLAVRGWQDVGFLRATWLHVVAELGGNIDVTAPRGSRSPASRAASCARYLSKYMLKGGKLDQEHHRYRSSRIRIPCVIVRLAATTWRESSDETLSLVSALGRTVHAVYFDAAYGLTWACGWEAASQ